MYCFTLDEERHGWSVRRLINTKTIIDEILEGQRFTTQH